MKKDGIEKYCKFCENARSLSDGDTMLCDKYGVVSSSHKCRRFVYDPMKREPKRMRTAPELEFVSLSPTSDEKESE